MSVLHTFHLNVNEVNMKASYRNIILECFPVVHLQFPMSPTYREEGAWVTPASHWTELSLTPLSSCPISSLAGGPIKSRADHWPPSKYLLTTCARHRQDTTSSAAKSMQLSAANRINSKSHICIANRSQKLHNGFGSS